MLHFRCVRTLYMCMGSQSSLLPETSSLKSCFSTRNVKMQFIAAGFL